jgi:hypothetical protein
MRRTNFRGRESWKRVLEISIRIHGAREVPEATEGVRNGLEVGALRDS